MVSISRHDPGLVAFLDRDGSHCIVSVCALEALGRFCLDCQAGRHVRDFEGIPHRRAVDHNNSGDIFTIAQRGGVGADSRNNQAETIVAGSYQIEVISLGYG